MALPTAETPIAKSLHTLTVLQQVARYIQRNTRANDPETALEKACDLLGLSGRPDPYGLFPRALELLERAA